MKKFMFLYYGEWEYTQAMKEAWGKWFASIGNRMVDGGSPFGPGREITPTGTKELPLGKESLTGYSIINADNIDEAEKLLKGCPIIKSVRVYPAMSM